MREGEIAFHYRYIVHGIYGFLRVGKIDYLFVPQDPFVGYGSFTFYTWVFSEFVIGCCCTRDREVVGMATKVASYDSDLFPLQTYITSMYQCRGVVQPGYDVSNT